MILTIGWATGLLCILAVLVPFLYELFQWLRIYFVVYVLKPKRLSREDHVLVFGGGVNDGIVIKILWYSLRGWVWTVPFAFGAGIVFDTWLF